MTTKTRPAKKAATRKPKPTPVDRERADAIARALEYVGDRELGHALFVMMGSVLRQARMVAEDGAA